MTIEQMFERTTYSLSFMPGEIIFREGQSGKLLYVVTDGEVDIVTAGTVIATVGAGGIVGEMALISDQPRWATAIARTECVLVPVDKQYFNCLVQQSPSFALHIMQTLVERLRLAHRKRLTWAVDWID